MKHLLCVATAVLALLLAACSQADLRVGYIVSDNTDSKSEALAVVELLKGTDVDVCLIDCHYAGSFDDYDVVWCHTLDTIETSALGEGLRSSLLDYVSRGGKVLLSMDAVHLLNLCGIEPQQIETYTYDAVDEGYGRKLGFQAYRSHPIFDGLFGGAYTWHGKVDNVCVLNGFTGDNLPKAEGARVVATQWEYIFNRPDKKLIWQTPYGEGEFLAVGGCLYYNRENFHREILKRFTLNTLSYLGGREFQSEERYWDYSPVTVCPSHEHSAGECSICAAEYSPVRIAAPQKLILPQSEYRLSREAENFYFDLPTHRSMIVGNECGGIEEIWTHPIMSLRDYRVWVDLEGRGELICLSDLRPRFEIYPYAVVRHYSVEGVELTETITSAIDDGVTVVHYDWQDGRIANIITDFKSNLRFMWPYDSDALGSLYYTFSNELNGFVTRDANREMVSIVGANLPLRVMKAGRYNGFSYENRKVNAVDTELLQTSCSMICSTEGVGSLDVVMVAGSTGEEDALESYAAAMLSPSTIVNDAAEYYDRYLGQQLSIETPDSLLNESLRWAAVSSSQFIVDTPSIGRSLMAGYSSSRRGWGGGHRVSGRPGYAWYFGRDAAWSGLAFDAMGDFETVRNVLETFIKYQQVDGKIYHELMTCGVAHFDASDATPLFVVLMADYLRSSGDLEFVRKNIAAVHKAMDYCYSTDTDGDGLIEISNVGHGFLEGGELFGSQTEMYLCGTYRAALRDASYIAEQCGDKAKSKRYMADYEAIAPAMEGFWNEKGYYNYALRADDTYTEPFLVLPAAPILLGVVDAERSKQMSRQFADPSITTDWGVRTLSEFSKIEDGGAYTPRNVWPLYTGWVGLAEYKTGLYDQGYATVADNLQYYKSQALGRIPEVINGDYYRSSGITLHQCWSEAMAQLTMVRGVLGFEPDACAKSASLSPRLPYDWQNFEVDNMRIGDSSLSMKMTKRRGTVCYEFTSDSPVELDFSPILPAHSTIKRVVVDGRNAPYSISDRNDFLTLKTRLSLSGKATLVIDVDETMAALVPVVTPRRDALSVGFRLMNQQIVDGVLTVELAGRSDSENLLELYLPAGYASIEGAKVVSYNADSTVCVAVKMPHSDQTYCRKEIKINALPK
ncbi:MAG: GH116 family glycosyl hydrolase [Tidjanibacter sp.]|nr:GH116 family glycosyl hydrolase [Tidjanibacter sp.]